MNPAVPCDARFGVERDRRDSRLSRNALGVIARARAGGRAFSAFPTFVLLDTRPGEVSDPRAYGATLGDPRLDQIAEVHGSRARRNGGRSPAVGIERLAAIRAMGNRFGAV